MTSNHDEFKPCPFCGKVPKKQSDGSIKMGCICGSGGFGPTEKDFNRAYCWKLLDEKAETIRSQDERIAALRSQLKYSVFRGVDLDEEIRRLRDWIDEFGEHREDCSISLQPRCNCGLDDLLQETSDTKEVG